MYFLASTLILKLGNLLSLKSSFLSRALQIGTGETGPVSSAEDSNDNEESKLASQCQQDWSDFYRGVVMSMKSQTNIQRGQEVSISYIDPVKGKE